MSFAGDTKNDLCGLFVKKPCCRRSLLLGILRVSSLFSEDEIRFTTRSAPTAALTAALLSECFPAEGSSADPKNTEESGTCPESAGFSVTLTGSGARAVYRAFDTDGDGKGCAAEPRYGQKCTGCRTAFLRGVFLSCGNVTDPEVGYHLDLTLSDDSTADGIGYLLEEFGLPPKRSVRKGAPVLYYKESEAVEDFLTTVGAAKASFAVMNAKILKELRNNANRLSNCELANIGKTVGAATVQYEAIRTLIAEDRLSLLPPELQQTARLRCENPDLPLKELALLHEPPLTKSGLDHRLRKIVDFVQRDKE